MELSSGLYYEGSSPLPSLAHCIGKPQGKVEGAWRGEEGGTLNCAPSADAVAGNGPPLMRRPCADAVAGRVDPRSLQSTLRRGSAEQSVTGGRHGTGQTDDAVWPLARPHRATEPGQRTASLGCGVG